MIAGFDNTLFCFGKGQVSNQNDFVNTILKVSDDIVTITFSEQKSIRTMTPFQPVIALALWYRDYRQHSVICDRNAAWGGAFDVKVNQMTELWQTMNEPDVDPRLAKAVKTNHCFAEWLLRKFLPDVELGELAEVRSNFTREKASWSSQSKERRETDLHIVLKDIHGDHYAILIEGKVVAPSSDLQPEDYHAYAKWGEEQGKWRKAVPVLIAPQGYLYKNRITEEMEIQTAIYLLYQSMEARKANRVRNPCTAEENHSTFFMCPKQSFRNIWAVSDKLHFELST